MALANYTDLLAAIAANLHRTDLTSVIPDFVASAEAAMNRRLRARPMTARATAPVAAEYVTLPVDFREAIAMTMTDGSSRWPIKPQVMGVVAESVTSSATGRPMFYAVVGASLRFYPAPDASYTVEYDYFCKVPALSTVATNWMLTDNPDCYLYGALSYAGIYIADPERAGMWRGEFERALGEIKTAYRIPVGTLRTDPILGGRQGYNIMTDS